jgi:hypothetical protein
MRTRRAAIEQYYTEAFKTTKAITNDCDTSSFRALNNSTVLAALGRDAYGVPDRERRPTAINPADAEVEAGVGVPGVVTTA